MISQRIKKLRNESLEAQVRIDPERAILVTEYYSEHQHDEEFSMPMLRAGAFQHIMLNKEIYIGEGELIVGERGPSPKATPTYPEICLHSLDDLEILHSRPKVPYKSDDFCRQVYREKILPFWKGKTIREKIFSSMEEDWLDAYSAGIFTEFQEQRAPGHTVLGDKIYKFGFIDLLDQITQRIDAQDILRDGQAAEKIGELTAMAVTIHAVITYARRHATELEKLAESETDPGRRTELLDMARICRKVPQDKPDTFHEALQYYWFVHVGVITELNPWDSFNPGRLDQHLYPFYKRGLEEGTLTVDRARELLQAFWIKFNNHPAPPKIGVTAKESNTYTDFALINVGGLKEDGSDACNELTYLILDVVKEMRLLQPSSMVQVSSENPDSLLEKALEIIKTGFGQPSVFNSDAIVRELTRQGKTIADARNGGASGCVEAGAFGTEAYFLTGYFNLPKVLEITLNNGTDPVTGKRIGIETGDSGSFKSFDNLLGAFGKQLHHFIDTKIRGNLAIEKIYAVKMPVPFLSVLIDDCLDNATDYNAGGARYNVSYIQGVGLGSITDMLTSLKYHVFDHGNYSMEEILKALSGDFEGYGEMRKKFIYDTPKYGNDDDYADEQAVDVFNVFFDAVDGRPTYRDGTFRINMLPTTSHVYFGSVMAASSDGRKAGMPLSEGISPVQGADRKGPTAVLRSAAKIDHLKTGGTLLNQKFTPQILNDTKGLYSILKLIRGYFRMEAHHIQFNVVSADTLRDAKKHPEKYRDLIVRVAGYSDYFNDLTEELQDEIIRRTEHEAF